MKKAFLETNAINHARRNFVGGQRLRKKLVDKGYSPVIGIHVIYELARSFLDPKNFQIGQELFTIVKDLDPSYSPPPIKLFEQEILKLRTGSAVLPFLDHLGQTCIRAEVQRLSMGIFDDTAEQFIRKRQAEIELDHPIAGQAYIAHIHSVRSNNEAQNINLKTFEDVLSYFQPQIPDAIYERMKGRITQSEAKEIAKRLDYFHAIRSTVMADVYLNFICIVHGNTPGFDKLDDYRHVIESSYSDALITGDNQLYKSANKINPNIEVFTCNEIC